MQGPQSTRGRWTWAGVAPISGARFGFQFQMQRGRRTLPEAFCVLQRPVVHCAPRSRLGIERRREGSTGQATTVGRCAATCYNVQIHKAKHRCVFPVRHLAAWTPLQGEREIFIENLLVRVHLFIEMSRPALRHGSLNSLFQVALYLPSTLRKRAFVLDFRIRGWGGRTRHRTRELRVQGYLTHKKTPTPLGTP